MRKRLMFAAAGLVVCLLALLIASQWRETPEEPERAPPAERASAEREPPERRAPGPRPSGERAEQEGVPLLEQPATEAEGVLEVEVLRGEGPVAGASVRLYWRGVRDPNLGERQWRLAGTAATGSEGRARLAARPGTYMVAVRAPGLAPLLREVVRPQGEERTWLQVRLEVGHVLVGRTVEAGSGAALPLVELELTPYPRELELWQLAEAPEEERVYAVSDERGRLRVEGLVAGRWSLEARAPGHAPVEAEVQVPAARELTVELPAASVVEGFVVDERGQPAAGAEVLLGGPQAYSMVTGEGGGFSVEVAPGTYVLTARRGESAGALERPLVVAMGRTVRGLQVRLGQGAEVHGQVVARASGAPMAGARVDVSPRLANGDSGRAVADEQGAYRVPGLAPGSYDVVVSAPGYSEAMRRGVTLRPGERFELRFELSGTGGVEGVVRDGGGRPVVGALVRAQPEGLVPQAESAIEARTDAQGRYQLSGLPAGPALVSVRKEPARTGGSQAVQVEEGLTQQVDFTLDQPGTLEGRVVRQGAGGPPFDSLRVILLPLREDGPGADFATVEVDRAGTFRSELSPGTYFVMLRSADPEHERVMNSVQTLIFPGQTSQVELQLEAPERELELRGVVLEPDGSPAVEASVLLETADESEQPLRQWQPSGKDGRFTFLLPVSAGEIPVTLKARSGGRSAELRGVRAGAREAVLRLVAGGSLRGRVVRADGVRVQGFKLKCMPEQGTWDPSDGVDWEFAGEQFELKEMPAGPVRLLVEAGGMSGTALVLLESGKEARVEISLQPPGVGEVPPGVGEELEAEGE